MATKTTIVIGILLVVLLLGVVSARDYTLYCLDRGEVMEYSLCNPNTADRVCAHDECRYCTYLGSKGFPCAATSQHNPCNARGLTCAASNYTPDITPPNISSLSIKNGDIYNDDKVAFMGEADEFADWYYTNEEGGRWKRICREEKICEGRIRLEDGYNNITLKVEDLSGWATQVNVSVFMDGDRPKIRKTLPKKKKFFGGDFWMQYREYNIAEAFLTYGTENVSYVEPLIGCPNGKKEECEVNVDLGEFDGQDIFYWFTIIDVANNTGESTVIPGKVDTTFPVLDNPDWFWRNQNGSKYVYFDMNITEDNFDEISYAYLDSRGRLKEKRLCSRLKDGNCYKKKSFRRGHYDITVQIADEAGHIEAFPISFDINY